MSSDFKQFMTKLQSDEGLKQELLAVGSQASKPVEAVIAFAESKGYKITAEDISGELTERQLDAVAGGLAANVSPNVGALQGGLSMGCNTGGFALGGNIVNQLISSRTYGSDRRLKSNIKRVGTHPLGIGIYEYDIFGRRERGVMADEVERAKPAAVVTSYFGIKMVNYGAL